ncbi:MAG: penicillin acylase family protein [Alphaproteobacteria bacterium]
MKRTLWSAAVVLALIIAVVAGLGGSVLLVPLPEAAGTEERLEVFPRNGLPLEKPVTIRWNEYQIPHIEAQTDGDAAFALGMVHAHLRLAQMEILKRIARGRISEMLGPLTADIDAAIRTLGFARAADDILAAMPEESRNWLQRYTDGVNAYIERLDDSELPHEFALLAMKRETWRPEDTIAIGRLGGADINWLTYLLLLPFKDEPGFAELWETIKRIGNNSTASFDISAAGPGRGKADMDALLAVARTGMLLARTGSNSMVIAPGRSASGAALLASDPHLGFVVPNLWLIAGLKSPGYDIVGMMLPGTPTFGFGRTPHIAWGGTNMRSLNSDFVDLSDVPESEFQSHTEEIGVRFWFDRTVTVRLSPYGPVLSDAAVFSGAPDVFALRWVGHEPTDEITALLEAARATNWREFRDAFDTFAIPAQNFLVADMAGNIAQITATQLPKRSKAQFDGILASPEEAEAAWDDLLTSDELPYALNPPQGFLASANNRPAVTESPIGIFFTPDERIRRLKSLLGGERVFDLEALAEIQLDVYSPLGVEVRDAVLARLKETDLGGPALGLIREWDGRYTANSRGALAFEAFLNGFAPEVFEAAGKARFFDVFAMLAYIRPAVLDFLPDMSDGEFRAAAAKALAAADSAVAGNRVWGDIHRLQVQHPLGYVPLIGGRYHFGNYPVSGSRETVMKTGHGLTAGRHSTYYGSQSRHLSDLSDPDANYFVLMGGQDGWLNSANFTDQVDLWKEGDFIRVPLTPEKVREEFPYLMTLRPPDSSG